MTPLLSSRSAQSNSLAFTERHYIHTLSGGVSTLSVIYRTVKVSDHRTIDWEWPTGRFRLLKLCSEMRY